MKISKLIKFSPLIIALFGIMLTSCSSLSPVAHNFKYLGIDEADYKNLQYYTSTKLVYEKTEYGSTIQDGGINKGKYKTASEKVNKLNLLIIPRGTPCRCISFDKALSTNDNIFGDFDDAARDIFLDGFAHYFDMQFANGFVIRYAIGDTWFDFKFYDNGHAGQQHKFVVPKKIKYNGLTYRLGGHKGGKILSSSHGIHFKGKKNSKAKTKIESTRVRGQRL